MDKEDLKRIGTLGGQIKVNKPLVKELYGGDIEGSLRGAIKPDFGKLRKFGYSTRLSTIHGAIDIGNIHYWGKVGSKQDEVETWVRFELQSDTIKELIDRGTEKGYSKKEILQAIKALAEKEEVVKL